MQRIARGRDEQGVAPIIAEILLVAMSVTLAGTVMLMSDNLMSQSIPSSPYVAFLPAQVDGGIARLEVADASSAAPATNYQVGLETGSASSPALPLGASGAPMNTTLGGAAYTVTWTAGAAPANLRIAVFVNERYETGGGQPLPNAGRISYVTIAAGAGFPWTGEAHDETQGDQLVPALLERDGLGLLVLHVDPEASPYPPDAGPTSQAEDKVEFQRRLNGGR